MLRLKEFRENRNLTQKELAAYLKTTNKSIWAYENGIAIPPLDVLIKLADFFDCSIDYLVGREDDFGVIQTPPDLSPKAQELLMIFNKLDPIYQTQVLEYTRYFGARSDENRKK